jgi:hypothetical protein
MAPGSQDLMTKLAEAGEAAVRQLSDMPGAERFVTAANTLKERLDDLQRRVRGLEALEERLTALELKVDRLAGDAETSPKAGATRKTSTAAAGKSDTAAGSSGSEASS